MDNKEQAPILGHPNRRIAVFLADGRFFDPDKWIEEDLASHLKPHAMLAEIAGCLLRVPHKSLPLVKE